MRNPENIKETWLNRIERGKSREIAREFFRTYTTQEEITKKLYPNAYKIRKKKNKKNFIMPLITSRVKEWKSYGFFDKSIPLKKEVLRYGKKHKQTFYLSLMNLEPIYKFCKDYKNIDFTDEEKTYFGSLLLNENYRNLILDEYPEESLIQATLKFYAKHCILKYYFYLKDIDENPDKYKRERESIEALNNPKTKKMRELIRTYKDIIKHINKKCGKSDKKIKREFRIVEKVASAKDLFKPENLLFFEYIHDLPNYIKIIRSIDSKILKALNLLPLI